MKNKNYFKKLSLAFLLILGFTNGVHAQVPSYVPSNGLVGYWPFTGNANDASGNGKNGTVNGATLTTDRNGIANSAYNFIGNNDRIDFFSNGDWALGDQTISFWFNSQFISGRDQHILDKRSSCLGGSEIYFETKISTTSNSIDMGWGGPGGSYFQNITFTPNTWTNIVYMIKDNVVSVYKNGVLFGSYSRTIKGNNNVLLTAGNHSCSNAPNDNLIGKLDDIGIWNRALTPNEITALYQGCVKPTVTPITAAIKTGENVTFTTPGNANATFQWQTNPANVGWQNLSDNTTYSGTATNALTLTNGQAHNNGQFFRVTANATGCNETSEPVTVTVSDVCTNYTTVTDLLVINVGTLNTNTPNYKSTITIYPNPAKDQITIDCGTLANVTGYQIKIVNTLGQEVYKTSLNQQQFTIPLNSWTGKGLYFVSLYDNNNVLITTRKIELQ